MEAFEVDPLICPECSGPMRIISFIEEEDVIRKILEHLKLWEEPEPRPPLAHHGGGFLFPPKPVGTGFPAARFVFLVLTYT